MLKTSGLFFSCLLIAFVPSTDAGISFNIASSATCSGNTLTYNNIHAKCTDRCQSGDTVTVTGYVVADNDFDDSTVTIKPCITGPLSKVCLYTLDAVEVGTVCNWITSDTVNCGYAADDYYLYQSYEIPGGLPNGLSWFTGLKIKAYVGDLQECESSGSYQMVAAAFVFVGIAAFARRRQLRLGGSEDKKVALLEMPDVSTVAVKGLEEGVTV